MCIRDILNTKITIVYVEIFDGCLTVLFGGYTDVVLGKSICVRILVEEVWFFLLALNQFIGELKNGENTVVGNF